MHPATTRSRAQTAPLKVREARGRQQAGSQGLYKEARGTVTYRVGFLPDQEGKYGEYLGSYSELIGSKTRSRCQVKGHACWGPSVLFAALSRE